MSPFAFTAIDTDLWSRKRGVGRNPNVRPTLSIRLRGREIDSEEQRTKITSRSVYSRITIHHETNGESWKVDLFRLPACTMARFRRYVTAQSLTPVRWRRAIYGSSIICSEPAVLVKHLRVSYKK